MLWFRLRNESFPEGADMHEYLLYCFDGPRLVRCDRFDAPDDATAIEGAIARHDGKAAELWCGSRKVKVFDEQPTA